MINVQRWVRIGRGFMALWILFAVPSAFQIMASGLTPANLAVVAGFAVWGVVWVWLWLRGIGNDHTAEVVGFVGVTALMTTFTVLQPDAVGSFLVFAFIVAGVIFPWRTALWAILGLSLLQVAISVVRLAPVAPAVNSLINSILVGGVGIGARLFWQSYVQLIAAREQLAHLAVSEERLRFARDLHDLLGQNLSVIVLKSELAAKQLPAGADESMRQEMREIAQVARKSLNDVREAVAGYRRPSLSGEIANARTALRVAGVGITVEDLLGRVPMEQDTVLAWCLREGITNVLRHSGARQCTLRLSLENGTARFDLTDDGRGATTLDGGSGLIGLRERVELAGGTFDVESDPGGGVRMRVSLPAGVPAPSELAAG